jgi:predicted ATPase
VCVLEDLHWADGETLEFLSFLLSEPPRQLALVLTYRSEELDPVRGSGHENSRSNGEWVCIDRKKE